MQHHPPPHTAAKGGANRGSVASAPTDVVGSGPKVQSGTAALSPPGQPADGLPLRWAAGSKQKSDRRRHAARRDLLVHGCSSLVLPDLRAQIAKNR